MSSPDIRKGCMKTIGRNHNHQAFLLNGMIGALVFAVTGLAIFAQTADPSGRTLPTVSAAARLSDSFAEVAKSVEPAVVSIDAKTKTSDPSTRNRSTPSESDDIMEFFRRQLPRRPVYSVGSGFVIDKAGYILTNAHVIDNAAKIVVRLNSGDEFPAQLIGTDEETDLAVLKIEAGRELQALKLADSNQVRVGDWVLAVGSPFGLSRTVTAGIVSQVKRETPDGSAFQQFIQTDAAINRGNSGGPLVNMRGEVIGMNSQIATSTGDYNGIGFALPANETNFVYKQLISFGRVKRGYLGVTLDSVHDEFAKVYGMAAAKGAIVTSVTPTENGQATPAAKVGIQPNDIIIEFQGVPVANAQDLIQRVASSGVGQSTTFVFLRDVDGKLEKHTVDVVLGERPKLSSTGITDDSPKAAPKEATPKGNGLHLGITLAELTPHLANDKHLTGIKGLFIKEIDPNGLVAEVRNPATGQPALSEGEVITRINRVPLNSLADFQRVVSTLKAGDPIVLNLASIQRDGKGERPISRVVQFTYQ